jgi:polyisoprenoid-binding protein YceI
MTAEQQTGAATAPQTGASTWTLDPAHTLVEFAGRHMMVTTVKGRFKGVRGTITIDEADPARSAVEAELDAASLDTGNEQRDNHLKSADFLEVEQYPTITFRSTRVEPQGNERARVTGDLTVHGVTREVTLDAELTGFGRNPWGKEVAGFEARTTLNRRDFGLTWNVALEAGGVLVSDTLKVEIHAEATK